MIGSGFYTAPIPPNSTTTVYQSPSDPDLFFCNYTLGPTAPAYLGLTINMTITSGPVYASDDPLLDNSTSLFWSANTTGVNANQAISLEQSLNITLARNWTRVISCQVTAIDPNTFFLVDIQSQPLVVTTFDGPAVPFTYPLSGSYIPSLPPAPTSSPTPTPTSFPTALPTPSPTPVSKTLYMILIGKARPYVGQLFVTFSIYLCTYLPTTISLVVILHTVPYYHPNYEYGPFRMHGLHRSKAGGVNCSHLPLHRCIWYHSGRKSSSRSSRLGRWWRGRRACDW